MPFTFTCIQECISSISANSYYRCPAMYCTCIYHYPYYTTSRILHISRSMAVQICPLPAGIVDEGPGCCSSRTSFFGGKLGTYEQCKKLCAKTEGCTSFTHGWKNGADPWCSTHTDCTTELCSTKECCGSGGGDDGVHVYKILPGAPPVIDPLSHTSHFRRGACDHIVISRF